MTYAEELVALMDAPAIGRAVLEKWADALPVARLFSPPESDPLPPRAEAGARVGRGGVLAADLVASVTRVMSDALWRRMVLDVGTHAGLFQPDLPEFRIWADEDRVIATMPYTLL